MSPSAETRPRIAAGTMVFNAWDILPSVIAHFVDQGVTDFYIVDHQSTGDPREEFIQAIPSSVTVHWVRKNSPLFTQPVTISALAHLARHDGFAAFIPFDADEFFMGTDRPLVDEIEQWLTSETTRSLRCPMFNFYQSSSVDEFVPSSLAQVHYRAENGEKPMENLTNRNPEFRRYPFSIRRFKAIMRLVPGADGDFDWMIGGNHHVINMRSGATYPATVAEGIEILHLPYRSRLGIVARRGNSVRRSLHGGHTHDTQNSEFTMADAERNDEWALASAPESNSDDRIVIGGVSAVRDDRLARREPIVSAMLAKSTSRPASFVDDTSRLADVVQDLGMVALEIVAQNKPRTSGTDGSRQPHRGTAPTYPDLIRKIERLQAQVDSLRPNLLRILLDKLRRR